MTIEQKVQDGRSWRHPFRKEKWEVVETGTSKSPERVKLEDGIEVAIYTVGSVTLAAERLNMFNLEVRGYYATDERINNPKTPWAGRVRFVPNK